MIITIPWLKEHIKTKAKESEIIDQLTNIGLEVEEVKTEETEEESKDEAPAEESTEDPAEEPKEEAPVEEKTAEEAEPATEDKSAEEAEESSDK